MYFDNYDLKIPLFFKRDGKDRNKIITNSRSMRFREFLQR